LLGSPAVLGHQVQQPCSLRHRPDEILSDGVVRRAPIFRAEQICAIFIALTIRPFPPPLNRGCDTPDDEAADKHGDQRTDNRHQDAIPQ
jgi:hypothetical protein